MNELPLIGVAADEARPECPLPGDALLQLCHRRHAHLSVFLYFLSLSLSNEVSKQTLQRDARLNMFTWASGQRTVQLISSTVLVLFKTVVASVWCGSACRKKASPNLMPKAMGRSLIQKALAGRILRLA